MAAKSQKGTTQSAADELAELLRLIAERAPALIEAGVTSFSYDGLAVTLGPGAAAAPTAPRAPEQPAPPADPFADPATYPGGRVAGYHLEKD